MYTNYRWEKPGRKGDRYLYKRDWVITFHSGIEARREEQVIATVTYDGNAKSPHWGKWHVNIGAQSPELNALRKSDIPKFSSKDDAIAWTTAMVRLSI
jgi:hypothetical protein